MSHWGQTEIPKSPRNPACPLDIVIARQFADEDPFGSPSAPIDYSEKKSLEPFPDWFVSMDSNSDGVVTEREFLGDNTAFDDWISITTFFWMLRI